MEQPQNPTPGTARETFHQEFFRRAQDFVRDTLMLVPELEGVAITPSWEVRQDRLPYGIVMGRNGPLRTPQEVLHMAEQLHGTLRIAMDNSIATLKAIDEQMGKMAEEISAKQAELDRLNKDITGSKAEGNTGDGAAPADPAQG